MTSFSNTLAVLDRDGRGVQAAALAGAACLAMAWVLWCGLAHVTIYETTAKARIETSQSTSPLQPPVAGRVVVSKLLIGRLVQAGEVLVELDSQALVCEMRQQRAKWAGLRREAAALEARITAERETQKLEKQASLAAIAQASAAARESQAPARYAEADLVRVKSLHAEGLIAERDYQRAIADAMRSQASTEGSQIAVTRLEREQLTRESERSARIQGLEADLARLHGEQAPMELAMEKLEYEMERRRLRSPVTGKIGDALTLRAGSVVQEGQKLAAIVPAGEAVIVAEFPTASMGRIREGQHARMRLDGFAWGQYGTLAAKVARVGSESRDGAVRVELTLAGQTFRVPVEHGLPGAVEVEVEQTTPWTLVLRNASQLTARGQNRFLTQAMIQ